MVKSVLLLQPRSAWGNHVYLVNGLLATAARLMSAGIQVIIRDLNIDDGISYEDLSKVDMVGIGVLGSPYIPQAFHLAKLVRDLGYDGRIFFGGPIMENILPEDWQRLFDAHNLKDIVPISDEVDLQIHLGLRSLPSIYNSSMGDAIQILPEHMLQAYFEKEFCIFTSDNCIYNCNFCGAHKGKEEEFRSLDAFRKEIATLAKMVAKYAGPKPGYEIYLSTLDGLQNPTKMEPTLEIIHDEFANAGVYVPLRFLATGKRTHMALQGGPEILHRWRELGVECIGLGVDGDDVDTWRKLRKTHNKHNEIQHAINGIKEAGIVPETFMIFGGPLESEEATLKAVAASKRLTNEGCLVRPYFMKMRSPKLTTKNTMPAEQFHLEPFLGNINLFYQLDYGMVGSELTNPNPKQRAFANEQYLGLIEWLKENNQYGCPTQPLLPTEEGDEETRAAAIKHNSKMPMDR